MLSRLSPSRSGQLRNRGELLVPLQHILIKPVLENWQAFQALLFTLIGRAFRNTLLFISLRVPKKAQINWLLVRFFWKTYVYGNLVAQIEIETAWGYRERALRKWSKFRGEKIHKNRKMCTMCQLAENISYLSYSQYKRMHNKLGNF